jgi:hypothetical protein
MGIVCAGRRKLSAKPSNKIGPIPKEGPDFQEKAWFPMVIPDKHKLGREGLTDSTHLLLGLNRLRKKLEWKTNSAKDGLAGAEARLIPLSLLARLKPCPYYKAPCADFFSELVRLSSPSAGQCRGSYAR